MSIAAFVHRSARSKVVLQADAISLLPTELAELGVHRPLLIAGRKTALSPVFARARAALRGLDVKEYTDIPGHSSVGAVETAVALARAHRADGFIAVGGGSASDTAKAAALLLAEGGRLEDHASRFTPPDSLTVPELKQPKLPVIAVPCTASGAEVTPSLGIRTGDGRKLLFWDVKLASSLILIDPVANCDVPAGIMLATGMNGLAHCVEGLYSKQRTPVAEALALHAMGLFAQALPRVAREPQCADHRAALLTAGHLSGQVLMNARTCLHHAICHALGAVAGVPHGEANAVVLPHAMAFNAQAAPQAMAAIARTWEGEGDACARVRRLQEETGVPRRLRDIGVPQASLAAVADKVMTERGVYFNPRKVAGAGEIRALLEEAW